MDLRVEVFLVGETTIDSVIVVSAGEIAISAIAGLIGIFSVLASLALDTHITTHTTITPITIHTTVTRIRTRDGAYLGDDNSGDYRPPKSGEVGW